MPRVNALLTQAMANLRTYHETVGEFGPGHSWSALYLPLSNLLGRALTVQLRNSGELTNDYTYVGRQYRCDKSTEDHVIPLRCIIICLQECSAGWPAAQDGVARLRGFMTEHLVIAKIPNTLNDQLAQRTMPNQNWWQPVGPTFSLLQKRQAMWARYALDELELIIPCDGIRDFIATTPRQL